MDSVRHLDHYEKCHNGEVPVSKSSVHLIEKDGKLYARINVAANYTRVADIGKMFLVVRTERGGSQVVYDPKTPYSIQV